jgi:hypothetical protein
MPMVALDAPRKKIVPMGSIEARWVVEQGEVDAYIKDAKKQPRMQALMEEQAAQRLADEKKAKEQAAIEAAAKQQRLKAIGFA